MCDLMPMTGVPVFDLVLQVVGAVSVIATAVAQLAPKDSKIAQHALRVGMDLKGLMPKRNSK